MLFSYWVMGRERTTDVALRQHPLISPTNFTFWWSVFNSFIIFIFIFYLICRYLTITFLKCQESIIITKHFLKNIQCYSLYFQKVGEGALRLPPSALTWVRPWLFGWVESDEGASREILVLLHEILTSGHQLIITNHGHKLQEYSLLLTPHLPSSLQLWKIKEIRGR